MASGAPLAAMTYSLEPARLPRVRNGQELGRQGIFAEELPVLVKVLGPRERAQAEFADGLLHRVERRALARQDRELHELVKLVGKRRRAGDLERPVRGDEARHGHPVERQGPRLVDAEDGRGAERLDGRDPARQDALARDPPGAEGEEHRQDHGELLRQHRHRDGQAGEQAFEQAPAGAGVEDDDQHAHREPHRAEPADDAADLALEGAPLLRDRPEGLADAAHLGRRPGRGDLGEALPGDDESAREDPRGRVGGRSRRPASARAWRPARIPPSGGTRRRRGSTATASRRRRRRGLLRRRSAGRPGRPRARRCASAPSRG